LGGSNTNSGGISVLTGGLQLKAATAAGSGAIKLAAVTLLEGNTANGGAYANAITLTNTASSTATILATTNSTFSGLISDSTGVSTNALSLIIDGANTSGGTGNTVTFAQTSGVQNSYYGKTTLQGGAGLSISRADHLGNTSAVVMGNKTSINVTTAGFSLPPLIL
jgi:hypothetical protein